jgi:Leucine-rich repeat (LRR) protein
MLHLSQCDQKNSWLAAKNALTIIPATISSCKSLMKFDVSDNMITSLPSTLDQLNELVEFDCHGNQLIALPSTMGHLKNIQRIECLGNLLTEPGLTIYLQVIDKSLKYFCNELSQKIKIKIKSISHMLSRVAILSKFKTSQFKCTSCCLHF